MNVSHAKYVVIRNNDAMMPEPCRRILGPNVPDEVVASHFRSSLTLCSSSSSSASPLSRLRSAKSNEMAVAEKIKKHMVREGREADAVAFTDFHQVSRHSFSKACLQHSQPVVQPCMLFLHNGGIM